MCVCVCVKLLIFASREKKVITRLSLYYANGAQEICKFASLLVN